VGVKVSGLTTILTLVICVVLNKLSPNYVLFCLNITLGTLLLNLLSLKFTPITLQRCRFLKELD